MWAHVLREISTTLSSFHSTALVYLSCAGAESPHCPRVTSHKRSSSSSRPWRPHLPLPRPASRPPSSPSCRRQRRRPRPTVLRAGGGHARRGAAVVAAAALDDLRPAIDEYPEGVLSGEWPDNFSLLSYADLRAYLESQIRTTGEMSPAAKLGDVMSHPVQVATPGQRLGEVDAFFAAQQFSGMPVVDKDGICVGVFSKKDRAKAANGMKSTVGEVMSSPAITLTPDKTVLEAAALMLKKKVHRIPVVNEQQQVIGIVTRTGVVPGFGGQQRSMIRPFSACSHHYWIVGCCSLSI